MKSKIQNGFLIFYCPGCKVLHKAPVNHQSEYNNLYAFSHTGGKDNTFECPSLTPGMTFRKGKDFVCDFVLEEGMLEFSDKTTHQFKGKKVPLSDLPTTKTRRKK
jgi:hypothetical protein